MAVRISVTLGLLTFFVASAHGQSTEDRAIDLRYPASALLAIDQNRTTVVDRIVAQWGDPLERAAVGLSAAQLKSMLSVLRADHLLAASLAGTLNGLRDALANAATSTAAVKDGLVQSKALGDATDDLVYTPISPCRILDTRVAGGPLAANVARTFLGYSANFSTQGGTASNCGMPNGVAAIAMNVYAVNPTTLGFIKVWAGNGAEPAVATINYQTGITALANGAIVPVDRTNNNAFKAKSPVQVDFIADVVGYFRAPSGSIGTVSSIATGTGLAGGPITTSGTISIANLGVGTAQIAANAVTQAKLSPTSGAAPGKVLGTDGTNLQWQTASGGGTVTAVTASAPLASSGGSAPNITLTGGTSGQVLTGTAGAPAWSGSPTLSGTLTVNGNLGVGTSTPASRVEILAQDGLSITGYQPFLTLRDANDFNTTSFVQGLNGDLSLLTDSRDYLVVKDFTGNVGLNTPTPAHHLDINGGPGWTSNGWIGSIAMSNASAIAWWPNAGGKSYGIGQTTGGLFVFNSASAPGNAANPANYLLKISDTGNVIQPAAFGGLVKAMALVAQNASIVRCYSAQTDQSSGNCGISIGHPAAGYYDINFGFSIQDRYILTESIDSFATGGCNIATIGAQTPVGNVVRIEVGCGSYLDSAFMIFVF